jgi:hypothetical protein
VSVSRAVKYTTAIVVAHLLVNIVHGVAHRELHVGLSTIGSVFVVAVVLILPLAAMVLVCAAQKRLGLILLSLSMLASLLFGLYHHFLVISPDDVHSQPASPWGIAFIVTAYGLLITEAIGAYVGFHLLWAAKENPNKVLERIRLR